GVGDGNGVPRSTPVREGVSRSDKRIRMSLVTLMRVARPSEGLKPARVTKQQARAVTRLAGVEGNGACRTMRPGTERPRAPAGEPESGRAATRRRESITAGRGRAGSRMGP